MGEAAASVFSSCLSAHVDGKVTTPLAFTCCLLLSTLLLRIALLFFFHSSHFSCRHPMCCTPVSNHPVMNTRTGPSPPPTRSLAADVPPRMPTHGDHASLETCDSYNECIELIYKNNDLGGVCVYR